LDVGESYIACKTSGLDEYRGLGLPSGWTISELQLAGWSPMSGSHELTTYQRDDLNLAHMQTSPVIDRNLSFS
jgi:hypothetical protein